MTSLGDPIDAKVSAYLQAWAIRARLADGTPGRVTLEIIFDTTTGEIRDVHVHRKMGADTLDQMGQSAA